MRHVRDRILNIIHRGVKVANRLRETATQTPDPEARTALTQAAVWLEMGLRDCVTAVRFMELEGYDYLRYHIPHYIPADPFRHWVHAAAPHVHH